MTRQEKLRIAAAIANVLVAAHRAGIVHRDLKPENVMLTKSGEVKVLDFGLARWLQKARAMSSSGKRFAVVAGSARLHAGDPDTTITLPPETHDSSATAAGITLGTPLYMSPEQARGETLTTASDMFSFGLLLQALFTGQDPHPFGLGAREVILRAASGETTPVQGVHGDISALINRLKQFAPADRLTAVETVERLQHLAEKPQRLARRAAVAAVAALVAFGGWRYTVDLQRERAIAVAAQEEAMRRRAQAEDLLEFMLVDLREKLEPLGKLGILDAAAQRSLGYFASLDPERLTVTDLVRNAKALHQLGDVRIVQGELDEAMKAFQQSLKLTEAAVRREPGNAQAQLAYGTSHFWMGNAHRLRNDLPPALVHWRKYLEIAEKLAASDPANEEYLRERAYGHSNVATVLELQGDLPSALTHNRLAMEIKKALLARAPGDAARQADYAASLNKVGFVLRQLGDLHGAQAHFRREFAILEALSAKDPSHSRVKRKLQTSRSYIATVLESLGRDDEAIEQRRAELAGEQALHESEPANVDWQRNLAMTQTKLADLHRRNGDARGAASLLTEAEALMRDLVSRPTPRPAWRRDLAVVRVATARVHLQSGRAADALVAVDDAIHILGSSSRNDPAWRRFLADAHLVRGDALASAGRRSDAARAWADAAAAIEPIAPSSTDPLVLDVYARTQLRTGGDADPLLQRLERSGYRHRDLMAMVQQRRTAAEGE
jgi:serine/threonine-protein kinase